MQLPDSLLKRIGEFTEPLDRFRLLQTSKRLNNVLELWEDISAVEISYEQLCNCKHGSHDSDECSKSIPSSVPASSSSTILKWADRKLSLPLKNVPSHTISAKQYRVKIVNKRAEFCIRTVQLTNNKQMEPHKICENRILKTLLARVVPTILELTVWDSSLPASHFSTIFYECKKLETVRLWNCGKWLSEKRGWHNRSSSRIITSLLSQPQLRKLLILDTGLLPPTSTCRAIFSKHLAKAITAPLKDIQLTACRLPTRSLEILVEKCRNTLKRLSIGCTFGEENHRLVYTHLIRSFVGLKHLDLPPFLFHLDDNPKFDDLVKKLIDNLPLESIGFRHFNSTTLFRLIESTELPMKINILRVYHNSRRIPNFAELGHRTAPAITVQDDSKKVSITSTISSTQSILTDEAQLRLPRSTTFPICHNRTRFSDSAYSSTSTASSASATSKFPAAHCCDELCCTSTQHSASCGSNVQKKNSGISLSDYDDTSITTATLTKTNTETTIETIVRNATPTTTYTRERKEFNAAGSKISMVEDNILSEFLAKRNLTIFAIAEGKPVKKFNESIREDEYSGVHVVYVSGNCAQEGQEILGRMGSPPSQSPYVYTRSIMNYSSKNAGNIRIIKGDLVKTIPLSSLGMESDYESD